MAFPPRTGSGRPRRPAASDNTAAKAQHGPREGDRAEGDRIAKLLARAGVASRREIERMIEEGRIALNGEVITTPATLLMNLKGVTVDGTPITATPPPRLFMFHKPSGLLTAERDPAGRPTIYTALRNALPPGSGRVMPVGRLDLNTEGLLLLTNDGELKRAMELPVNGVPRTYRARTFGAITQARLEELMEGIEIDGIRYGPINANLERSAGHNKWIELTLTEGKNREVRRVLEHLGLEVSRLLRLRYGPFDLGDLPRGGAEEVPQAVVERFRKALHAGVLKSDQIAHAGKAYQPRVVAAPAPAASPEPRQPRDRKPLPRKPREEERLEHKSARPPRRDGPPRGDRPVRSDAPARGDRPVRSDGPARGDRPVRSDGPPRSDRPARPTRPGSGPRKPRGRG
ncbi:MAG: hypothetical protein RIS94_2942 [Pseudomonadota bacterium]|jgi:23S rRNA pseudouridine2605 synthase